jgi:hypothetical protein
MSDPELEKPMSEADFDARIKKIEGHYNTRRQGADALRDQELARLFHECKWTQEAIAQKMGKSRSWIVYHLRLGAYLEIVTIGDNLKFTPQTLTERRFRDAWRAVGKGHPKETQEGRFKRVTCWLEEHAASSVPKNYMNLVHKPGIKQVLVKLLTREHALSIGQIIAEIREKIPGTDGPQVTKAIANLRQHCPKGMVLKATHYGKHHRYRLAHRRTPGAATASVNPEDFGAAVIDMLPLIKECIEIMKRPVVGRPETIALDHLWRIQQTLEGLLSAEPVDELSTVDS